MTPIALSSIRNIRDLGGTLTADGRTVRSGCLIRSAHLGRATEEDLLTLRTEHRLRTVIDLRTPQERTEHPDRAEGLCYLPLSIVDDLRAGITHEKDAELQEFPDMAYLYGFMISQEASRAGFSRVLRAIFSQDYSQGAVLWHCTEGKDRCGMTTALVLEALGVDRETILADYLATNQVNGWRAQHMYEKLLPLRGEAFARSVYRAYLADERYLRAAWDAMGDHYLTGALGLEPEEIQRFREQVLS